MRKGSLILIIHLIICQILSGQYLARYQLLPEKYLDPDVDVNTGISEKFSDQIWWVYADRDSVYVYNDRYLSEIIDTVNYLESFAVWEETENALRIVSQADSGELFIGAYFSDGAIERGWVEKRNMILWPRVLKSSNLQMKVMINRSLMPSLPNPRKPVQSIQIPEGEIRIYNVLKIDGPTLLLLKTDQLHSHLTREDAFWIERNDVRLLESREAYIPRWDKVLEGMKIPVYASMSGAENKSKEDILFSIGELNPYMGFFELKDDKINALYTYTSRLGEFQEVYLNNVVRDFEQAFLVDYNQFLVFKEFMEMFSSYEYFDPEELEAELGVFFTKYGMEEEQFNTMSVGEMLEMITGIDLKTEKPEEIIRVGDMGFASRNYFIDKYSFPKEIYSNEQEIDRFRFISDMFYYWLPASWIEPAELFKLALAEQEIPLPPIRSYDIYELYYLDGSSVSEMNADVFNYIYDSIKINLTNAVSLTDADSSYGVYAYLSNGINTVKNDHKRSLESIVEDALINFRSGTDFPDKNGDKIKIEWDVLTQQVESITNSLVIHSYIPERFLNEDLQDGCYFLKELPERFYSLAMPKVNTSITIKINVYDIINEEELDRNINLLKSLIADDSEGFRVIVNKFN